MLVARQDVSKIAAGYLVGACPIGMASVVSIQVEKKKDIRSTIKTRAQITV